MLTIVSGLPRSGTSVMMQMLEAGGLPALTDGLRLPDEDNPRGYYEFEPVKQIKRDASWLKSAAGRVVKMVHLLLTELPVDVGRQYRVVMMRRNLREVLDSQARMLLRHNRAGAGLPPDQLMKTYEEQLRKVTAWLAAHPQSFKMLEVNYNRLIADPHAVAADVNRFLGGKLDEAAMAAAVDPSLYRNRR